MVLALLATVAGVTLFPRLGSSGVTSTGGQTTVEAIIAGSYPSAQDKQGTGGVQVTVRGLFVLYVHNESDGDWHVAVTDGKVATFITEIIPRDQAAEGRPLPGTTIDETGTPFCDSFHQNDNWHGFTCWEIHPITAWRLSAQSLNLTTTTVLPELNVSISYASDPVAVGSNQTIYLRLSALEGAVANQVLFVHVDYASGTTKEDFTCETLSDGSCSVSWTIARDAGPGTYGVTVDVGGQDFESTFVVTA